MKVIIAGCREYNDYDRVCEVMKHIVELWQVEEDLEIVSGHAPGADALGERYYLEQWGCDKPTLFCPDWTAYGDAAGPMRNERMADYADALVAFWDGNKRRSGTHGMIQKMIARGKPVHVEIIKP